MAKMFSRGYGYSGNHTCIGKTIFQCLVYIKSGINFRLFVQRKFVVLLQIFGISMFLVEFGHRLFLLLIGF
jgi:hypothetical protein